MKFVIGPGQGLFFMLMTFSNLNLKKKNYSSAITISGSATTTSMYHRRSTFQKFKYENDIKMKNKPDPALSQSSYPFYEIKKGHQNLMGLSLLT
jgi:hypothetical protein